MYKDENEEVLEKQDSLGKVEDGERIIQGEANNFRQWAKELAVYGLVILICIFVMPRYVVQRTEVSGSSMENTLKSNDSLLVEKFTYNFTHPKRFDIVVFYPYGKESKEYYVKRVIGKPGETVQIKENRIYIDNKELKEDYGKNATDFPGIAKEPLVLGSDEYFVMGDNRESSLDSRYEEVGPVKEKHIVGRAVFRIWPLNKFGILDKEKKK